MAGAGDCLGFARTTYYSSQHIGYYDILSISGDGPRQLTAWASRARRAPIASLAPPQGGGVADTRQKRKMCRCGPGAQTDPEMSILVLELAVNLTWSATRTTA